MTSFRRPKNIFSYFLSRRIDGIYYSMGLRRLGIQMIGLYEPVFLYLLFGKNLSRTFLFFGIILFFHSLLAPLGGKMMARFGVKRNFIISLPFLISFYLLLFLAQQLFWLIYLAPLAAIMYRISFFPAYHTDFALISDGKNRGKQIGLMNIIMLLGSVLGPAVGGFLLMNYGFSLLFLIVVITLLFSLVPIMRAQEIRPRYKDSSRKAWQMIFQKKWRKKTLSLFFYGIDWGVTLNFWPLFLFILAFSYQSMGLISAAALLVAFIATVYVSQLTDRSDKLKLYRLGCYLASLGNILKAFVLSPFSAIAADGFFQIGDVLDTTPLIAYIYDKTRQEKINVGRVIMLREISQNLGTAFIYFSASATFLFLPESQIYSFFLIAAVALMLAGWLSHLFEKQFIKNFEVFEKELLSKITLSFNKKNKEKKIK